MRSEPSPVEGGGGYLSFLSPEIMKGTDWRAVERAVARVMSHCGWTDVRIVGRAGDGGGDVIGVRDSGERRKVFVAQVKSVMGSHYVGPSAIQESLHALSRYGGDVAVVATNGDFTKSAYARAAKLRAEGYDVRLWNGKFLVELLSSWPEPHHQRRSLRPYQSDIVERCLSRYAQGGSRALFVVATGLGKSVIAAELLNRMFNDGLKRLLVLCHTQPLALQLEQEFWTQIDKSIPTRVFFAGAPPKAYDGINFGLYQTFLNYLSGVDPVDYDVVVVDEAHHVVAHGFRRCITHLRPRFLIGMTATPWRGDGKSIYTLFGAPIAKVSLVDGMLMGYLAQVDYRIYCDTIDWDEIPQLTGGCMTVRDLNKRLFIPQRDEAIVDEVVRRCADLVAPRIIIFCASVEHAERFGRLLSASSPFSCACVSGVDPITRNRLLMEFASGKIQALTAVDVLNEGIDVPDVNVLVFLRATHSRRVFVQQLGRGLRLAPGKDKVLVLDFVTDIRRLADVLEMDREARDSKVPYQTVFFPNGIVRFNNETVIPFVDQWIKDIADLGDTEDSHILQFPEVI